VSGSAHRMRAQRLLLELYRRVGPERAFDSRLGRRVFVASYFLYKRWLEDSFAGLARLRPAIFRGGEILDVGANVGYTATVFAAAGDPGARVHAFEPEARNFAVLGEVAQRRRSAGRIVPIRAAVGSAEGVARLWINRAHHADHRVLTDAFAARQAGAAETEEVPLLSLDGYVRREGLGRVAFVKIDVQGYELEVCRGMAGLIDREPRLAIAIEYAPDQQREMGYDPAAVNTFLVERGFRPHVIGDGGSTEPVEGGALDAAAGHDGYADVLYLRGA